MQLPTKFLTSVYQTYNLRSLRSLMAGGDNKVLFLWTDAVCSSMKHSSLVVTTLEFHAAPTLLGDNKPPPTSRFPFPVKFLKLTQTACVYCVSIRTMNE